MIYFKKTYVLIFYATIALFFIFGQETMNAQCYYTSSYLADEIETALEIAGIYDTQGTFTYGSLSEGKSTYFTRTFYAGNTYYILACGDDNARDIDISLYGGSWNLLRKDESEEECAMIKFTPYYTGTYRLKVHMYDSYNYRAACYSVVYGFD